MASASQSFLQEIGVELGEMLGDEYRFMRSRRELRAEAANGFNSVVLNAATKYSPFIGFAFYFGRIYSAAREIEARLGPHRAYFHVQQFSYNRSHMQGLSYDGPDNWSVDITDPPAGLSSQVAAAIHGMADPFFARFADLRSARDAISARDPWCFSGEFYWRNLLLLDAALDDLPHFDSWAAGINSVYRDQAAELVAILRSKA